MIKEIKQSKLIMYLILLNPFLDLIIGIESNSGALGFSLGAIIRFLILGFLVFDQLVYLFTCKSKESLFQKIYFFLVIIYIFSFFYLYATRSHTTIAFKQLLFVFRYFSFPAYLLVFKRYTKNIKVEELFAVLSITSLIYSILVLFPFVTNTGFNSYSITGLQGHVGWFGGANEIGLIIGFCSLAQISKINRSFLNAIGYLISVLAMIVLGTKAALLFILIGLIMYAVLSYRSSKYKHKFKLLVVFFVFSIILIFVSPAMSNVMLILEQSKDLNIIEILLSGRISYFDSALSHYKIAGTLRQILGVGFYTAFPGKGYTLLKLVEMDFFDIFFRLGLVGTVLYFVYYFKYFIDFFVSFNYYKKNTEFYVSIVMVFSIIFFGLLIGHVFTAPSVSILLAIMSGSLFNSKQKESIIL